MYPTGVGGEQNGAKREHWIYSTSWLETTPNECCLASAVNKKQFEQVHHIQ